MSSRCQGRTPERIFRVSVAAGRGGALGIALLMAACASRGRATANAGTAGSTVSAAVAMPEGDGGSGNPMGPAGGAPAGAGGGAETDPGATRPPLIPGPVGDGLAGGASPGKLAWVNPARCLSSCTHDPTANLVRVDGLATPSAVGRHLVDAGAQAALQALLATGQAAGHNLLIRSAFRSYDEQVEVFRTTKQLGRAARPGHSEHQLGTAIDVQLPTKAAIAWLAVNAPEFGFVISYPAGKQRVTGYRPEPWHVRFVGTAIASELARTPGQALEELLRARPELGESGSCEDCPAAASRAPACTIPAGADGKPAAEDTGRCRKAVLTWCYEGSVTAVDCAAFGQICGRPSPDARFECLPAPEKPARSERPPRRRARPPN